MCNLCDENSYECEIFVEPLTGEYYLNHQTSQWDYYDDDFVCDRIYISYCPYCGRKLGDNNE